MTLYLATLPEDRLELAVALERHLVGPDLEDLIGELAALHGEADPPFDLRTWLAPERAGVLTRGLAALPLDKLRQLLRFPALLFDLQEWVLSEGGAHWDHLLDEQPEVQALVERTSSRLRTALNLDAARNLAPPRHRVPASRQHRGWWPSARRRCWWRSTSASANGSNRNPGAGTGPIC